MLTRNDELWERVRRIDGYFTRPDMEFLVRLLDEHAPTHCVEIGCLRGRSTQVFGAWKMEAPEQRRLTCVDGWHTVPHPKAARYQERPMEQAFNEFKLNTAWFRPEIIVADSLVAAEAFAACSLDLVFVDDNHEYGHVARELKVWSKKVRQGCVLCGHDFAEWPGVGQAVREFSAEVGKPVQSGGNMWCVVV